MDSNQLVARRNELQTRLDSFKTTGLNLDMTRGKPSAAQLDLAAGMLSLNLSQDFRSTDGSDCRNYGGLAGIPEARQLFAQYLEVQPTEVWVAGNSSLALMHDAIVRAWIFGVPGGSAPWSKAPSIKFLCPVPGYDRHFAICAQFGIEMIPINMTDAGPDMDAVEAAVRDEAVKGIWCVPKYSNPTGCVYSKEVVQRLAKMKTAAADFRIFWDNAYAVHHLGQGAAELANILDLCRAAGNPLRPLIFGSTSKVSLAGAGVGLMAADKINLDNALAHVALRTIGPDKLNQLRHVRFFGDMDGIRRHMKEHAKLLQPRFAAVQDVLEMELGDSGAATWTKPTGGYFVSMDLQPGCAARTAQLAADVGVRLTAAGATYPHGKDPEDKNIRIAPTLPPVAEIRTAMQVVAVCSQLAAVEKRIG